MKLKSGTAEHRSWNMSRISGKNTSPEKKLRSLLFAAGYRFRLHAKDLPGKPDIIFRRKKTVIFVHGCFWHRHPGCKLATTPKSNSDFWQEKFQRNVERDKQHVASLRSAGWKVGTIWECELEKNPDKCVAEIKRMLGGKSGN